jgi:hypothetical protein
MQSLRNLTQTSLILSAISTFTALCEEVCAHPMWCEDGTFAGVHYGRGSFLGVDLNQPELDNIYEATNWLASKIYDEGEFDLVEWVEEKGDNLDWVQWPELFEDFKATVTDPWEVYSNISESLGFEA